MARAIVLHPPPAMGGDRDHPLVIAIADGLTKAGVATLRPNLTDPDPARSAARLAELAGDADGALVLIGYSWGSVVASMTAPPGLVARVLVAPPVAMIDLGAGDGIPTLVLAPTDDQYGGPAAVRAAMEGWEAATVEEVDGADHFLTGAVQRVADRAVSWTLTHS